MDIFNEIIAFAESMHISALIIISIILLVFFMSVVFSFILRGRYAGLHREVERQAAAGRANASAAGGAPAYDRFSEPRFRNPFLRGVVADFEAVWAGQKGVEVNTQAIIENHFDSRMKAALIQERFTRHSISVMIVLGLLGTFLGLTISVQSLVHLFNVYDVTELLNSVESGLLSALAGMSTAFTTSLFGIACSVAITFFSIFVNPAQAREKLMSAIENYLDNQVSARLRAYAGDGLERMNDALRNTFIEFGERIADRFDRTLTTMREDVRGIEEVNNNLRNTIAQMDVCFVRITDALKSSTRHVDDNYRSLAALSDRFDTANAGFDAIRRENALFAEELVKSVTEASRAITGLTDDLRGEAQRRLENFSVYDAAISRMAVSADLIRDAVAAIPDQMYAYSEASRLPAYPSAAKPYIEGNVSPEAGDGAGPGARADGWEALDGGKSDGA